MKKFEKIFFSMIAMIMMVAVGSVFTSCTNDDDDFPVTVHETQLDQALGQDTVASMTRSVSSLSDWNYIDGDATSCLLQHSTHSGWYVTGLDLRKVYLRPVYQIYSGSMGNDPYLKKQKFTLWNNSNSSARSLFNASFFLFKWYTLGEGVLADKAKLAHFLSDNGTVVTYGYEDCNTSEIRYLNVYSNYATIEACNPNMCLASTYAIGKQVVVGGFSPYKDIDGTSSIGRTMVGIKDSNGDGKAETLYVFSAKHSSGATIAQARNRLINDFGCSSSNIIMFDGSASSSMAWKGNVKVSGADLGIFSRYIPVLLKATLK